jgi:CheY-like chemotaxis protein
MPWPHDRLPHKILQKARMAIATANNAGVAVMFPETIGRPMEILVVEDDRVQARLAWEAVNRGDFPHRTTLIGDGREALDFVLRRGMFRVAPRPDLVLLDLRLPGMDGLDVLAEIRSDESLKAIPVVIMTSSQDEQDRLSCQEHCVEAYLSKPVDLEKFLSLLRQLKQFWHEDMLLPPALAQT